MENMRDSGVKWIGDIPSHWEIKFLHQVVSCVKNKNLDLAEKNLLSLSYGKIKRKDINTNEGLLPLSFENYNVIEKGDIVLRLTDLQNDHTSLRVGRAEEKGIITSAYTTLRPFDINYSKYLYYLLHSFDIKKGFYGMGSGVRQGLGYDELKNSLVLVPPLAEQTAIAKYLDKVCAQIDDIIEETKKSAEDYKKLRLSVISEAVTCGLDKNAEMKDSGVEWIGKVPKGWKIERLKNLFTFGKGLPITKENLLQKGIAVISYGQIHSKTNLGTTITDDLIKYVSEDYLNTHSESLTEKYDFLMADTSEDLEGCGNCVYVDKDFTLFAGYHTIILSSVYKQNNKYLAYLFKTDKWRNQIKEKVTGIKLFSISRKILNTVTVMLPPIPEQKAIAEYLDKKCAAIDEIIAEKENLITDLELYKKSLIYETVTGKRKAV